MYWVRRGVQFDKMLNHLGYSITGPNELSFYDECYQATAHRLDFTAFDEYLHSTGIFYKYLKLKIRPKN